VRSLAAAAGREQVEIITVAGEQPSRQRNLAAQRARGRYLYFLDHDSRVPEGTLALLLAAIRRTGAAAAGGPNIGEPSGESIDEAAELALGSKIGSPLVFSRYHPEGGSARYADEKSLILCNLLVRREVFLAMGGFDPRLYPNEENEFLNRLRGKGERAVYVPAATVAKRRKYSLLRFAYENFRYGRGRMEQIWTNIHGGDAVFLGALGALVALAAAAIARPGALFCLVLYAGVVVFEGCRLAKRRIVLTGAAVAGMIFLRHAAYGFGLAWGVVSGWRARSVRIYPLRARIGRLVACRGRARAMAPDCPVREIEVSA
jgi:glycosyltransferase involved in cell wall biosynthesis